MNSTLIVWFTGALAALAFVQCIAMFLQWRAVNKQAEYIANADRAWLMVRVEFQPGISSIANSTSTALRLDIRNDGNTPAWIEDIALRVEVIERAAKPPAIVWDRDRVDLIYFQGPRPIGIGKEEVIDLATDIHG